MEEKCEKILKAIEDLNIFIGNQNWENGGKVWGNIEGDLEDETGFHKTLLLSPDWVSLCPSVDVWKRCTFCSKSSSTSTFGTVTARHVRVIFPPSDILATLIYVGPMMRYISTPPKSWSNIMFTMRCHCKSRSTCSHLCKIARIVKYLWIYASLALLVVKDQNYSVENILQRETQYKLVDWGQTFLTQSLAGLSHQSELCKFFVKNEGIHISVLALLLKGHFLWCVSEIYLFGTLQPFAALCRRPRDRSSIGFPAEPDLSHFSETQNTKKSLVVGAASEEAAWRMAWRKNRDDFLCSALLCQQQFWLVAAAAAGNPGLTDRPPLHSSQSLGTCLQAAAHLPVVIQRERAELDRLWKPLFCSSSAGARKAGLR